MRTDTKMTHEIVRAQPSRTPHAILPQHMPGRPSRYTFLLCGAAALLGVAAWDRRHAESGSIPDAEVLAVAVGPGDIEVVPAAEGSTRYYVVTIHDSHDEDGDVVELRMRPGSPFSSFVLTRSGHRVLVRVPDEGPALLVVKALKDGSGINKVSFAARTSGGVAVSRILAEGEEQIVRLEPVR